MRVCVCVCVCMCQHVKQHRNHPPWGFGFLTPPGLDCNANLGEKKSLQKVWNDLGRIWEGFGKLTLEEDPFFRVHRLISVRFPYIGKTCSGRSC